jgi:hypothetical protein
MGFRSCADPGALQKICDRLGPGAVQSFFWRWASRLPSPWTAADHRAGYVYAWAFRQFEVSDPRVFDRPAAGRAGFEGVIRDPLDIGRPDPVALMFQRPVTRRTPGVFRTRGITEGVDPTLCAYYKSSRIQPYFKEGRALRTETVIRDTRDFGIGRRVCARNWNALRAAGESASARLCEAQAHDAMPAPDVATFHAVTRPSTTADALYASALRLGDARVMAVFAALVGFCHLVDGFTNRQLVDRTAALLHAAYTSRQATDDLRRLRRKGLIEGVPHTRRHPRTALGRRMAVLFTKAYGRVLTPALRALDPALPDSLVPRSPLASAWRTFEAALERFVARALVAA